MRLATTSILFLALGACTNEIPGERRDGGGGRDAGGGGGDAGPGEDGGVPPDGGVITRGMPRAEICGNEFDDDDDGMIDNGCDCVVGTERPCWLGPPDARGVGVCHDGTQRCESDGATGSWAYCMEQTVPGREILDNGFDDDCDGVIDEPDGICVSMLNEETGADCGDGRDNDCDTQVDCDDPDCVGEARCPPGCDGNESLCWGGYDDDCDSDVDCGDSDCSSDPSCDTGPCPTGQTPTYRERTLPSSYGGSSIRMGDGGPRMPMSCEPGSCPDGQVAVVLAGRAPICVPPPPDCPDGQNPTYIASGVWRCDPPCELIIHYGSIYGGRQVCAGRPDPCPAGQTPTFVYETESWQCRPRCDGGLYDPLTIEGLLVCVPC